MKVVETINEIKNGLKLDYPELTNFELLSLAIQIQRNQILTAGLVVSPSDKNPAGLEAIAIALGYK